MTARLTPTLFAIALAGTTGQVPAAYGQEDIDPDATRVLAAMSDYLGGLTAFTASYDADFDVIAHTGQKLKFASAGTIALKRPDRLRVTRTGVLADVVFTVDGQNLTIYGSRINRYHQMPAGSIDEAVSAIRDQTGFDAPGADLLVSRPFSLDVTDIVSGQHLGMAQLDGKPVHHLAFRGDDVDWQLWIEAGDTPLPLRYVITSKWQTGAPEYVLRLHGWDIAPDTDPASFSFTPPAGSEALLTLRFDELGQFMDNGDQAQ